MGGSTAMLLLAGLFQPIFAQGDATLSERLTAAIKGHEPTWKIVRPFVPTLSPDPSLQGVLEGEGYSVRVVLSVYPSAGAADEALERNRRMAYTAMTPSPLRTAWRDYRRANVVISIIADASPGGQAQAVPTAEAGGPTPASVLERVAGLIDGLVSADVKVDACVNELFPDERAASASGPEAFFYEIRVGCLPGVERALAAGADPNGRDAGGSTPLMQAVGAGHRGVTQALLRAGADPNAPVGETGPPAFRFSSRPPAYHAGDLPRILANQLAILDDLLAAGASIEARNGYGRTLLLEVARMNADDGSPNVLLSGLLARGADVSSRDREGRTAVILAVMHTLPVVNLKTLPVLLAAGADVNAQDASGKMAMDYARERADKVHRDEWRRVLRLLAGAGAVQKR